MGMRSALEHSTKKLSIQNSCQFFFPFTYLDLPSGAPLISSSVQDGWRRDTVEGFLCDFSKKGEG